MAEIRIDPETLKGKAQELNGYKANHDEAIQHITTLVSSLGEIWAGQAMTAFTTAFEGMKPTFTDFAAQLEELSSKMNQAAAEMEAADQAAASKMG